MLLLFETSAGYALFKVLKPNKLDDEKLWEQFTTAEKAGIFIYISNVIFILSLIICSEYGQIKGI